MCEPRASSTPCATWSRTKVILAARGVILRPEAAYGRRRKTRGMDAAPTSRASGDRRIRPALYWLFAAWIVLLVWLVLWKFQLPYLGLDDQRAIKLVPFVASGGFGASAGWEVPANLLLFLPLGVYLGLLAPSWRWPRISVAAACASLALEVAEYILAVGSSDVTDVIVNTVGALTGVALVAVARRRWGPHLLLNATCALAALTLVAFVAIGLYRSAAPPQPEPVAAEAGADLGAAGGAVAAATVVLVGIPRVAAHAQGGIRVRL